MKTETTPSIITRNVGQNRGKARIWIEGPVLLNHNWNKGDKFYPRFGKGVIVFVKAPASNGAAEKEKIRAVAGKEDRPILDTNTDRIKEALNGTDKVSVEFKGEAFIVIRPL